MKPRIPVRALLLFAVLVLPSLAGDIEEVDLVWDPGKDPAQVNQDVHPFWRNKTVWVAPIVDKRGIPRRLTHDEREDLPEGSTLIGVSPNDDRSDPGLYATTGNPAKWLTTACRFLITKYRIRLDKTDPDYVVKMAMRRFWVVEENTYTADIIVDVSVCDRTGRVIWSGPVQGLSRFWGDDFEAEQCTKALGNACIDLVSNLLAHSRSTAVAAPIADFSPAAVAAAEEVDFDDLADEDEELPLLDSGELTAAEDEISLEDGDEPASTNIAPAKSGDSQHEDVVDIDDGPVLTSDDDIDVNVPLPLGPKPSMPIGWTVAAGVTMIIGTYSLVFSIAEFGSDPINENPMSMMAIGFYCASGALSATSIVKWTTLSRWKVEFRRLAGGGVGGGVTYRF